MVRRVRVLIQDSTITTGLGSIRVRPPFCLLDVDSYQRHRDVSTDDEHIGNVPLCLAILRTLPRDTTLIQLSLQLLLVSLTATSTYVATDGREPSETLSLDDYGRLRLLVQGLAVSQREVVRELAFAVLLKLCFEHPKLVPNSWDETLILQDLLLGDKSWPGERSSFRLVCLRLSVQ